MGWQNAVKGIGFQLNPFDGSRTYDTNAAGRMPGYRQVDAAHPPAPKNVTPAPSPSDWRNPAQIAEQNAFLQSIRQQTAAIAAQTAAMPRLPSFDILGNYNRARSQAEANQRPLYDKMLNTFLEGQGIKKSQKQADVALGKENVASEQRQAHEDTATSRQRTAEDFISAIANIGTQEGQFQQDSGDAFDTARRTAQEGVAASGLTTSGLGQQAIGKQAEDRNITEGRQTEQFQQQREAKQLFKTRTFADLERGDLRADEKATLANKGYDLDLDQYLQELAQGEKEYRQNWESDLLTAIAGETDRLDKEGVMQFINSLAGSGARAQDIALAQQVYGR